MNNVGCFVGTDGLCIETFTGKAFPVKDIRPELIDLKDIAHALSMVCRYAGHCREFYSVAEHSVHVHSYLNGLGHSSSVLKSAILHDAAEAYLGDVTRPLKSCLSEYRLIENRLQQAIYERFDAVPSALANQAIHQADSIVLRAEAKQMMSSGGKLWTFGDVKEIHIRFDCWNPQHAESRFLFRCTNEGIK